VDAGMMADVPNDTEWLNIGVFGLIPPGGKDFRYSVQLAVSKSGVIRGIQWDMRTQEKTEVAGSIDPKTFKVAWRANAQSAPYFETNVDQITQSTSYLNAYDPDTKSLVSWQAVQIKQEDLPNLQAL